MNRFALNEEEEDKNIFLSKFFLADFNFFMYLIIILMFIVIFFKLFYYFFVYCIEMILFHLL